MNYQKYYRSVNFLESLNNLPNGYKKANPLISVFKMKQFLKLIGNPEKKLKFIHITGTAGKGSTVNLIHNILFKAGYKVGSFYSPHITTTIERIRIGNRSISPDEFINLTDYLKPYLSKFITLSNYGPLNYFETLFALALLAFQKAKCDYVILEAFVGGLTDTTNIIPSPKIAIITNINKDHEELLGDSLLKIAKNKVGIIKPGCIFITTEKRKKFIRLFKKVCRQKHAKFQSLLGQELVKKYNLKNSNLDNALLAITATKILKISDKNIIAGLKLPPLPCRFEIIQKHPTVILDGSHNPTKINSLISKLTSKSFNLVFACASDKDATGMLKQLLPYTNNIYLTRFLMPFRKVYDLKKLQQIAKRIKPKIKTQLFINPNQAFEMALKETKKNEILLVTGSFFLCGDLRKKWISEEYILQHQKSFKT